MVTLLVRKAKAMDIPFLTNSWLESFREGHMVSCIPNRVYYAHHHSVIEQVMSKATVLVVCPETDPDIILAWMCFEKTDVGLVIHYAYTKRSFRRQGFCKRIYDFILEEEKPELLMASHLTQVGRRLLEKIDGIYNPYILFMDLPKDWQKRNENHSTPSK